MPPFPKNRLMSNFTLVIGNKNFSSWSMRGWLAMKLTGAPFEEKQIWLDEDLDRSQRLQYSPVGKVPILQHGEVTVWDSLAIGEYLAEQFPDKGLWPRDSAARARARALCAEMHSGFAEIREKLPMNCRARKPAIDRGPGIAKEVDRLCQVWTETRAAFGSGGSYLFGDFCLADAFYAPVASRFTSYAIPLPDETAAYVDAVLAHPLVEAWVSAAESEGHSVEPYASMP